MDILIRNVSDDVVKTLKERAKRKGHSLQAELLSVIEASARPRGAEFISEVRRLRAEGKVSFDVRQALSALHEDRSR